MKAFELLKDCEHPHLNFKKGTVKTKYEWEEIFDISNPSFVTSKTEWFKEVEYYSEEDMLDFAKYILIHKFHKEDKESDIFLKWKLTCYNLNIDKNKKVKEYPKNNSVLVINELSKKMFSTSELSENFLSKEENDILRKTSQKSFSKKPTSLKKK